MQKTVGHLIFPFTNKQSTSFKIHDSPILLFFSFSPLQPTRKKKKKKGTQPCLEETGRELDFILLFLLKNKIGALKSSPPCRKASGSALLCSVRLLLVIGWVRILGIFRFPEIPPAIPAGSSPICTAVLLAGFMEAKLRTGKPREVTS
ncbi:hypothetical protein SLEP1_g15137 [Rubroshorea leprosula]|uniref:Uncharacterized protein n=1 Tax=Rubroshorea leprosula TaxID=152421 RepID=A0AAV5ISH3_9ROSI|nr:hypothetical protein SLEP1_g15137 [Rubroshorea leprosula]